MLINPNWTRSGNGGPLPEYESGALGEASGPANAPERQHDEERRPSANVSTQNPENHGDNRVEDLGANTYQCSECLETFPLRGKLKYE